MQYTLSSRARFAWRPSARASKYEIYYSRDNFLKIERYFYLLSYTYMQWVNCLSHTWSTMSVCQPRTNQPALTYHRSSPISGVTLTMYTIRRPTAEKKFATIFSVFLIGLLLPWSFLAPPGAFCTPNISPPPNVNLADVCMQETFARATHSA